MLKQLERLVKKLGITKVASDLGYRSATTVRRWIVTGEIPELAKVKVKSYLNEQKGK